MARERTREQHSDDTYNARRRFIRAAERYLEKSNETVGQERTRYRTMAREAIQNAAQLFERRGNIQRSEPFTRLSRELGVNLNEFMPSPQPTPREIKTAQSLISESFNTLVAKRDVEERRESEARAILNSPVGKRIYGGLVDVWAQPTYENGEIVYRKGRTDIDKAIMNYYGVDSMMDVIEIIEKQIPDLYADPESLERYDQISLALMRGLFE